MVIATGMTAQKSNDKQDRRQGLKKEHFSPEKYRKMLEGFITKEVNLSENERQKFYPLLNEMMEAQRKLMDEEREILKSGKQAKTEADFEHIVTKTTELQVENRRIEQTYYKKFAKVLTWEKIYKVRMAITKFNMHALRKFSPQKNKRWKRDAGRHKERKGKD